MNSDDSKRRPHSGFRTLGTGMTSNFSCHGCKRFRPCLGSKGVGARRRCAECVTRRQAKAKETEGAT